MSVIFDVDDSFLSLSELQLSMTSVDREHATPATAPTLDRPSVQQDLSLY